MGLAGCAMVARLPGRTGAVERPRHRPHFDKTVTSSPRWNLGHLPSPSTDRRAAEARGGGSNTYALPDVQGYSTLTVAFTCDAHVGVNVRIGDVGQPGGYDTSSTDCAGALRAYTTPVLDPAHLPASVSVSAPTGVQVSLAVYGVLAQELDVQVVGCPRSRTGPGALVVRLRHARTEQGAGSASADG